jgi:hypothetical protein
MQQIQSGKVVKKTDKLKSFLAGDREEGFKVQCIQIKLLTSFLRMNMGVWQGVAMDSLKFHQARLALFHPVGGLFYGCFRGGLLTGRLLPLLTPYVIRL